jgi:hypothetical protein
MYDGDYDDMTSYITGHFTTPVISRLSENFCTLSGYRVANARFIRKLWVPKKVVHMGSRF